MSEHSPLPWKTYAEGIMDKEQYPIIHASHSNAAYIVECVNSHDALVEQVKELEDKIAQIHSALDGADSSRAKCRDYNELAVSNGLALGRIALILGHEYNEGRKSSEGA